MQANSLNLSLFQFDYDLTFAAFFLNADGTIYGRYGTRSDGKEAARDISVEGFRKSLAAALKLHENFPRNKKALARKTGAPPKYKKPEDFPSLKGKFTANLDYTGKVARSCIHCHQVRDAQRLVYRTGNPRTTRTQTRTLRDRSYIV